MSNPQIYSKIILPTDDTAAAPSIQMGGGITTSSGTGIRGDGTQVLISVAGTDVATINSSGITATVTGTASRATNLAEGLGGSIPYQSAANTTAMLTNGTVGQVLTSAGTTLAPTFTTLPSILVFTSAAGGGGATEVMTLTGFLATDTILAVTQKTPGANSLPLLGYSTPATNALTAIFSADPGAGAVIIVSVKR